MAKIKVSADTFLSIIRQIMNDEDINYTIEDTSAPAEWLNKTVQDALNIEYFTYRHRPVDTELIVRDLISQGQSPSDLCALSRSFCILSLNSTDRVYSKDTDTVTVSANMEFWVQTDKVKLLEDMFEDIAVATSGIRIPVQIGKEERQAIIALGTLNIAELDEMDEFGEMAVCDIDIDIIFYQKATSKIDYTVEFYVNNEWVKLPFNGLSFDSSMNQKAVPYANKVKEVGSINLSRVKTLVLAFEGYDNAFIDNLADMSLEGESENNNSNDNNQSFVLKITRKNTAHIYDCVVKNHVIKIEDTTGNEIHTLTLTTRGIKNGTA